jgi:glycosyltransferase involved in cell wall biosynthesis
MTKIPILFWTDAPDHHTGLARICRDLAGRVHHHLGEVFRVGTLGFFGKGSARLPWTQYTAPNVEQGLMDLRRICDDFFEGERGILFTITPPSWLLNLALPQFLAKEGKDWAIVSEWLETRPFDLWSYLAIESIGPHGQFGVMTKAIIQGVDRALYYNHWGAQVAANMGLHNGQAGWLHHGVDTEAFKQAPAEVVAEARGKLEVGEGDLLIGCVATNTRRKQLATLIEAFYLLRHEVGGHKAKLWLHTDVFIREWNIPALLADFGLEEPRDVLVTSSLKRRPDDWMAAMYSACDVTVLPTGGEGFGYPVPESLACGTPCVTGSFGGQAEFYTGWKASWLAVPKVLHLITIHNLIEPVYDPQDIASRVLCAWTELKHRGQALKDECREQALRWSWENQWLRWAEWFMIGARDRALAAKGKEAAAKGKEAAAKEAENGSKAEAVPGRAEPGGGAAVAG